MYQLLIADDEPIERKVVCKVIEKYFPGQIEVIEAVNGREAVEIFTEKPCQILLLDIEMPGMNGLDAAEKIRRLNSDCSIIFLTAFDEFDYARRAITVRALDYLLKPAADGEIVTALEEAIRRADENERKANQKEEADRKREREQKNGVREATDKIEEIDERHSENLRQIIVRDHIRKYIEEHYREDLSLQDMAGLLHYSDAYFCKIFKQCFDKNFLVYLSEFRIEKAKELLEDITINIKDVGVQVGYPDSNYFTRVFKRNVGVTPTEYRIQIMEIRGSK